MDLPVSEAMIAAISLAVGALLTKIFQFLQQRYKDQVAVDDVRTGKIISGYQLTIDRLDGRIDTLEAELTQVRTEHLQCLQVQAELKAEIAKLNERVSKLPVPPVQPLDIK